MEALRTTIVLLVEDEVGDQKLVENAFSGQEIVDHLYVAWNGEEALEYLQRSKEGDKESPRPNLILLDLNMPGMDGKEFLRRIKADEDLCSIPVVVLTVSDSETDIQESYKLKAAGYVQKSASPQEFKRIVGELAKYWFETSSLVKS
jgi:CheY-like chemotaxis protein